MKASDLKVGQYVLIKYDDLFLDSVIKIKTIIQPNACWENGLLTVIVDGVYERNYLPTSVLKAFDTEDDNITAIKDLSIYQAVKKQHEIELKLIRKQILEKVGIN